MRTKKFCVQLGGLGALLICIPVLYRIHEGDLFNPTSYFLWSLLSLVCVLVLIRGKKGGYTMMIGYFFSDLCIGIYAYMKSGRASIGWFEWYVVWMTLVCLAIYARCELRGNFRPAVIACGTACVVAGIPFVVEVISNPYSISLSVCSLYLVVSVLTYYGELNFNGKFIPGLSIIYWVVTAGGVLIAR